MFELLLKDILIFNVAFYELPAKKKVEKTIKSKLIENDPDVKVKKRKDDRTDSDENNKQNQQKQQKKAPKSINKKQQTSDLSSEMQKCGNCNRNVVDLSKHLESKVCNGININENSTTCRGCKKQYLRLLPHLNSKNGKGCKDLYTEHELEKPSKEKKYYNKNRGKVKAKNKCYYENNREETSAMRRQYLKVLYTSSTIKTGWNFRAEVIYLIKAR